MIATTSFGGQNDLVSCNYICTTMTELVSLLYVLILLVGLLEEEESSSWRGIVFLSIYSLFIPANWFVDSIDAVDCEKNLVYFSGNKDSHTEKNLFVAPLLHPQSRNTNTTTTGSKRAALSANSVAQRVTVADGWHSVTVNVKSGVFVDSFR